MKNRFIIVVNNATKEQQDRITQFFMEKNGYYWHWLNDLWLFIDQEGKWSAKDLRDHLNSLVPGPTKMVFRIENGGNWAGFGQKESWEWMKEHWEKCK